MSLLEDLDLLLDEAVRLGHLDPGEFHSDQTRKVFRYCMEYDGLDLLGRPVYGVFHLPPRPKQGVKTSVLVMDRATRRQLVREIIEIGGAYAGAGMIGPGCVAEYDGVPIKLAEDTGGSVFLVTVRPTQDEGAE